MEAIVLYVRHSLLSSTTTIASFIIDLFYTPALPLGNLVLKLLFAGLMMMIQMQFGASQHTLIIEMHREELLNRQRMSLFYIDSGNQEVVPYSRLRPVDPLVSSTPGLAQLCTLSYIKVSSLEEDYGQDAAMCLSSHTLTRQFKAIIDGKDTSGGKVKRQGTGTNGSNVIKSIDMTFHAIEANRYRRASIIAVDVAYAGLAGGRTSSIAINAISHDCLRCCYSVLLKNSYPWVEGAMHHDCHVCFEYLFESRNDVVVMPCGHTMHKSWLKEMEEITSWYACPLCFKSVCDILKIWEKFDVEDCGYTHARTLPKRCFHLLANKRNNVYSNI